MCEAMDDLSNWRWKIGCFRHRGPKRKGKWDPYGGGRKLNFLEVLFGGLCLVAAVLTAYCWIEDHHAWSRGTIVRCGRVLDDPVWRRKRGWGCDEDVAGGGLTLGAIWTVLTFSAWGVHELYRRLRLMWGMDIEKNPGPLNIRKDVDARTDSRPPNSQEPSQNPPNTPYCPKGAGAVPVETTDVGGKQMSGEGTSGEGSVNSCHASRTDEVTGSARGADEPPTPKASGTSSPSEQSAEPEASSRIPVPAKASTGAGTGTGSGTEAGTDAGSATTCDAGTSLPNGATSTGDKDNRKPLPTDPKLKVKKQKKKRKSVIVSGKKAKTKESVCQPCSKELSEQESVKDVPQASNSIVDGNVGDAISTVSTASAFVHAKSSENVANTESDVGSESHVIEADDEEDDDDEIYVDADTDATDADISSDNFSESMRAMINMSSELDEIMEGESEESESSESENESKTKPLNKTNTGTSEAGNASGPSTGASETRSSGMGASVSGEPNKDKDKDRNKDQDKKKKKKSLALFFQKADGICCGHNTSTVL